MGWIDFILNIAGLLLWLSWRASRFDPMTAARPSTLVGTLRRAEVQRIKRWHFPAALGGLLLLRALFYWQIGSPMNWSASLNVTAISVSFASFGSGAFVRMLTFSILSFAVILGAFLLSVLLLSMLSGPSAEFDAVRRFTRIHIGRVANWPDLVKVFLPLFVVGLLWWLLSWPLMHWELLPRPTSNMHRFEQALVIGLASYLVWKYVLVGVLALHLVNSYIYLGSHLFWKHISAVARSILSPLRKVPVAVGKIDFAPVVMIVFVLLVAHIAESGLNVPPWGSTPSFRIPGLVDFSRYLVS